MQLTFVLSSQARNFHQSGLVTWNWPTGKEWRFGFVWPAKSIRPQTVTGFVTWFPACIKVCPSSRFDCCHSFFFSKTTKNRINLQNKWDGPTRVKTTELNHHHHWRVVIYRRHDREEKKNGSEQRSFLCWNEKVVPIGLLPSPNEFHFLRHFVYLLSARHNRKQSDGFLSSRMVYTGHGKWTTSKVLYDALSRSRECLGPNKWCNHSSFR